MKSQWHRPKEKRMTIMDEEDWDVQVALAIVIGFVIGAGILIVSLIH